MVARKRKAGRAWRLRAVAALALAIALGMAWYWWDMRSWRPDEGTYPEQGVLVGEANGLVGFATVRALGGQFAYLYASSGRDGGDARFDRNAAAARSSGLLVGAVHRFDPCAPADAQSANFVTVVPRDAQLLPPAIALSQTAQACTDKVSDAAVESELMTFINQVEMHAGKPAILKLSADFERTYRMASRIERDIWVQRDRFVPGYAGRPWLLWSANAALASEASEEPLEWVVVQP